MSRKHADLEREMIEDLASRTGRSLAEWMAAIDQAGLCEKNAIIDWLRPQGLTFAHASWLERIHNNDGKPIYLGSTGAEEPTARPLPPATPAVRARASGLPDTPSALRHVVAGQSPSPSPAKPAQQTRTDPVSAALSGPTPSNAMSASGTSLDTLLARGKGLRPLAAMLIREIAAALPGTAVSASGELVCFARPGTFAALLIGSRELRLGLDLGDMPSTPVLARARLPGSGPGITHMVVVTDARQVGAPVLDLVRSADARVNGAHG